MNRRRPVRHPQAALCAMLAVSAVLASACLGEDQPDPGLALHANVLQLNAAGKYTESIPLA
ncbi:MAG: hypothetical protein COZ06_35120, partial [Armatimonadetes bacterium CG_4_10_14_3_um_filter_66_18]